MYLDWAATLLQRQKLFFSFFSHFWTNDFEIKYVHQLQNLYYSLTGHELEVDLLADSSTTVSVGKKLKETNDE